MQTTSWPCATSMSQRCEPRKPAPPVTSILFMSGFPLSAAPRAGLPGPGAGAGRQEVVDADEGEVGLDGADGAGSARHQAGQAPGGDDGGAPHALLLDH